MAPVELNLSGYPPHIVESIQTLRSRAGQVAWQAKAFASNENPELHILSPYWITHVAAQVVRDAGLLVTAALDLSSRLQHHEDMRRSVEERRWLMDTKVPGAKLEELISAAKAAGRELTIQDVFNITGDDTETDETEGDDDE